MARAAAAPPPQYTAPAVSETPEPFEIHTHLTLLYQKQGELVQALTLMQAQLNKLTAAATAAGGGGTGGGS